MEFVLAGAILILPGVATLVVLIYAISTVYGVISGAGFVPTPKSIVYQMLTLARVTKNDRLVDLGAGDGRIVLAAARRGVQAIGYEINPLLVLMANWKITLAGLNRRAWVVWKNFWSVPLTQATVVTIYGAPHMMEKLETKLRHELKLGSRVVSHAFSFPHWPPTQENGQIKLYRVNNTFKTE